ncbi:MAG: aldehyde dehydrogenase [Propionibacteriaceae bacterium]|jgi:aldehyde dehydrogenase (NAD+)|nr:aldehyde dehydrogenase [Propionibacteriaceae bacterium]
MKDFSTMVTRQREYVAARLTRDVHQRQTWLAGIEQWIGDHTDDITAALKADLGKPEFEAYATEIGVVADEARFARRHLGRWNRTKIVPTGVKAFPSYGRIQPEPYGVTLIMSPWNYPFMLTLTPLISAIAAGNTAVVKPSAYSPATSALVARMCGELFDPGHVCVVEGGRVENQALLDQAWDLIFFTGSSTVGRQVMSAASTHLTPVVLELGGKSPCIVDQSANLELTARKVVWGKFVNAGQTCVAPDYLLVHRLVKDALIEAMARTVAKFYGPDPLTNPDYPTIINDKHFHRLLGLLDGEHAVIGGRHDAGTRRIEPTVVDHASWDSAVMSEEIFGPILPVLTYDTPAEVVSQVSSRPKPLATYVFTSRPAMANYFMSHLSFGGGCVNDTVVHLSSPRLPFGGVGASGMGRYHGQAGFDAFTHHKSILVASGRVDLPVRYPPYTSAALALLKHL